MFLLQYLVNNVLYEHCLHCTTRGLLFISCPSLTSPRGFGSHLYDRLAWRFVLKKCFFSFSSKVWMRVSLITYIMMLFVWNPILIKIVYLGCTWAVAILLFRKSKFYTRSQGWCIEMTGGILVSYCSSR
jgi:hypothetical protein